MLRIKWFRPVPITAFHCRSHLPLTGCLRELGGRSRNSSGRGTGFPSVFVQNTKSDKRSDIIGGERSMVVVYILTIWYYALSALILHGDYHINKMK